MNSMNDCTAIAELMGCTGIVAGVGCIRIGLAVGMGERLRYSMISEDFSGCDLMTQMQCGEKQRTQADMREELNLERNMVRGTKGSILWTDKTHSVPVEAALASTDTSEACGSWILSATSSTSSMGFSSGTDGR